jgi:gamma-glutamyltranspeptidase/glutathione hydrolase
MLRQGGNAVDAAVAASFASFVTEAVLVNIGGGGIAQVYNPATGQSYVFDFFSAMPGLSTGHNSAPASIDFRKIMVDFGPAQQPFYIGRASVAVPGVVAGLGQMLAALGRLPLAKVLAPAVRLARQGVTLTPALAYVAHILTPIFTDTPELAALYAPSGRMAQAGERLQFHQLADTLEQLGQQGPGLFYSGHVAQQILADQQAHHGLLTAADLAAYQPRQTNPIAIEYRGFTILLPPPPSTGGALIAFALQLLADVPLSQLPHNGPEHIRTLAQVMRLTNQARAAWDQGDGPAPGPNGSMPRLLSPNTLNNYRQKLRLALRRTRPAPEPPQPKGPSHTTHVSAADAGGMIAAITTSAGESAGFAVGQTGVTLNNMLGEIDLHPEGFHRLPPGQRLATMMSPVVVLKNNRPIMALGSGGSNRLRTAIMQVISNFIDFDMPLVAAVDAPRVHFEDNTLQLEGGIVPAAADLLEAAGYAVNRWPDRNMFFGGAHAVARAAGRWAAAGDCRRGGSVVIVDDENSDGDLR